MTTSAERMQLHRQRLEQGLRFLTIELRNSEVKELIRRGFTTESAATTPDALRKALYAFLDRHLSAPV